MDGAAEKAKMPRGELYFSLVPELVSERARCSTACHAFNTASGLTQIERVNLWNQYVQLGPFFFFFPLLVFIYIVLTLNV